MTKKDLIKWVEAKRNEAVAKAKEEENALHDELYQKHLSAMGVDDFINKITPLFDQLLKEYAQFFDKIDNMEGVSISKFGYSGCCYNRVEEMTDKRRAKNNITDVIHFDHDHAFKQEMHKLHEETMKVFTTYETVIQTVKHLPTAKDGIEYLKKLGFNVAEIQPVQQKQLPATLGTNVDIRYLMLKK